MVDDRTGARSVRAVNVNAGRSGLVVLKTTGGGDFLPNRASSTTYKSRADVVGCCQQGVDSSAYRADSQHAHLLACLRPLCDCIRLRYMQQLGLRSNRHRYWTLHPFSPQRRNGSHLPPPHPQCVHPTNGWLRYTLGTNFHSVDVYSTD